MLSGGPQTHCDLDATESGSFIPPILLHEGRDGLGEIHSYGRKSLSHLNLTFVQGRKIYGIWEQRSPLHLSFKKLFAVICAYQWIISGSVFEWILT